MRRLSAAFFLFALLVPAAAHAQATLAGVVRDSSDAVLPGVTVEASSPALIQKVRAAVTDGTGQYRITELPPGTYTLTVTLSGFSTVKREGVEVSGSGVIPINIALRVGAVSETITVTGETPVVDTQSARRQAVLSKDIINALPATRSYGALLTAIPGLMVDNTVNNGAMTTPFMTFFSANGGRSNEGRMMVDGLNVAAPFSGGGVSTLIYDVANTEEMQVSVSGTLGEAENGGPQVNLVPKSGGNTFSGSFFYQGAGSWSSGDNLTDVLRRPVAEGGSGLTLPAKVISSWDTNGSGGGPIKRDRLWFYGNLRKYSTLRPVPGAFANLNAGDATKWLFVKDPNTEVRNADARAIESFRITSQLTARNRVSFSHEHQHRCSGSTLTLSGEGCRARGDNWVAIGNTTTSPETFPGYHDFPYNVTQATWSSPVTSRLLLEAGFSRFHYLWAGFGIAPPDSFNTLIPVTEQSTMYGQGNYSYRGLYRPVGHGLRGQRRQPQQLARQRVLRHRRSQHESRLSGLVSEVAAGAGRQPDPAAIPLQQRRPERLPVLHLAAMGAERPYRNRLAVHPGPVDERPAHPAGRTALRPRLELCPRGTQWDDADLTLQCRPDLLPQDNQRRRLQRHHASNGCRLRRIRQRQDRDQDESGQVPAGGHQRRELLGQQPGRTDRHQRRRACVVGWQPQLRGRLRSVQHQRAGQPGRPAATAAGRWGEMT